MLLNHRGEPLTDAQGHQIKTGATVTHDFLGDGIARGTVPLDGGGVNVLVDWLGPDARTKPRSSGAQHLTVKFGT